MGFVRKERTLRKKESVYTNTAIPIPPVGQRIPVFLVSLIYMQDCVIQMVARLGESIRPAAIVMELWMETVQEVNLQEVVPLVPLLFNVDLEISLLAGRPLASLLLQPQLQLQPQPLLIVVILIAVKEFVERKVQMGVVLLITLVAIGYAKQREVV